MVRGVLICSDEACTAVYEAYGALEELEALACDCGCGLAVLGWPEPAWPGSQGERPVDHTMRGSNGRSAGADDPAELILLAS